MRNSGIKYFRFFRISINSPLFFKLLRYLVFLFLLFSGCSKLIDNDDGPCGGAMPGIYPIPPYVDPIWHPGGKFIGFNHIPLDSIIFNGCSGLQLFKKDSAGFWLIDSDGKNMRRILSYPLETPVWSPDGEWIAFVYGAQIFKMRFREDTFDTTTLTQLTFEGRNFFPAWSPDGRWIVYWRSQAYPEHSVWGLWLMSADGLIKYKILSGDLPYPNWSPDGKYIIFRGWYDSINAGIIRYEIATSHSTVILKANGRDIRYPKYSPDGTKIAFCMDGYLWIMDSNGNNLRKLTTFKGIEVNEIPFSWSPDGSKIVYTRYRTDDWTKNNGVLWVIDINTGLEKQLTFN